MRTLQPVDPCLCPLCGGPNHCAMEQPQTGQAQAPCWCTRETFSAQLLKQVPEASQGQACICQACARASHTSA